MKERERKQDKEIAEMAAELMKARDEMGREAGNVEAAETLSRIEEEAREEAERDGE